MASEENQRAPIAAVKIGNSNDEEADEIDEEDGETEETEEEEEEDDGDGGMAGDHDCGVGRAAAEEDEDVEIGAEEEEDRNVSLSSDPARSAVTVAVPPPSIAIVPAKRPRIVEDEALGEPIGERRVSQAGDDQARKLFQRLWTDEDEIGLLQGFLDYSTQRGTSQNNPHDTAQFYDQIKSKLQLDFNKNQLVEKLRRLKKKYRNVLARVSLGKEVQFKSPHDQATFEIATKIWGTPQNPHNSKDQQHQHQQMRGVDVDDDMPPNFNPASANLNLNDASNFNNFNSRGGYSNHHHHSDLMAADERKSQPEQQKAKKRIRVKMEDSGSLMDQKGSAVAALASNLSPAQNPIWQPVLGLSTPSLVEETVKNKISPLMYERYGGSGVGGSGVLGDGIVSPAPLSFASPVNLFGTEVLDGRWRKQQILELEVYSKRLELVQEQIKLTLEQLRSTGS
uniref:Glabrous enhancer-binding protein-like DBD domain-containing protein n=1 Tax=Kalanchoe fedtschenkoi TaxID=63787 RepID=A0A7N0VKJ4_KALFE